MIKHIVLMSGLLLLSPMALSESAAHPTPSIPDDLVAMKSLLGTWHLARSGGNGR